MKVSFIPIIVSTLMTCLALLFSATCPAIYTEIAFAKGAEESADWPMFGYDVGQTRYNSHEHTLGPTNLARLTVKRSFDVGNYNLGPSLVVSGDLLYVGSANLYALDQSTGTARWIQHSAGASGGDNFPNKAVTPVLSDGIVYAGAGDANGAAYLGAYDALSGVRKWLYGSTNIGNSLIVHGKAYISSSDDLVVLDTLTGIIKERALFKGTFVGAPAYADGSVYASSLDNSLNALDETTGNLIWGASTMGAVVSEPAAANGLVYVGTEYGWFYAFNAKTGATTWMFQARRSINTPPAVAEGLVYVGSQDNRLYALDASTGKLRWSYKATYGINTAPTVANGVVYFESGDRVYYALDAKTGKVLWNYSTKNGIYFPPIVANGTIYLVNGEHLEALGLPDK